jgi:multidrug efflux system membrane fusion protein
MRPVTVNRASASETVLADGVQPGDTVVTDGHLRLVPGSRISVKNEGQQADQSKPQVDRRGAP